MAMFAFGKGEDGQLGVNDPEDYYLPVHSAIVYIYIYIYIYIICIYICVCVCVCMYIYIYIIKWPCSPSGKGRMGSWASTIQRTTTSRYVPLCYS